MAIDETFAVTVSWRMEYKRARSRRVLGLRRSTLLLCLYMLGYMGYLVAGGVVFATLEGPYEMETKAILNVAIASFKTRNPKVTGTICFGHFSSHM